MALLLLPQQFEVCFEKGNWSDNHEFMIYKYLFFNFKGKTLYEDFVYATKTYNITKITLPVTESQEQLIKLKSMIYQPCPNISLDPVST